MFPLDSPFRSVRLRTSSVCTASLSSAIGSAASLAVAHPIVSVARPARRQQPVGAIPGVGVRAVTEQVAVIVVCQRRCARTRHLVRRVVAVIRRGRASGNRLGRLRAVAGKVKGILVAPQQVRVDCICVDARRIACLAQPRQRVIAVADRVQCVAAIRDHKLLEAHLVVDQDEHSIGKQTISD